MATAVGTNINLSALDKELEKLDKALDRFVKHSIDAQNKVNSAFNNMGRQGLKNFEEQLSRVQNKILEIGKKGVTMKWDSQNLARYIDQVNRLTEVLRQAKGAGFEFKTDNLNKDFQSISALTQELNIVKEWLTKGYKTTDSAGNVMYQQLSKDMQNYLVEYKKKIEDSLKFQNQSIMEQINNVRKALQVELKETEATEKKKQKVRQKANETYAGSIKYSNNAKTLEQERQAIANLEAAREKLKKTDADYATKLETLNQKINEHRINVEAATKTEAQRNALTSSTRAEYARLLAEQDKLRKSYIDLKTAQQVSGPTKENTAALQNIVKRYRDVYAEILRYKQSANGQLDATERKFLAEQAKLFADAEKRKTDIARKEAIERSKLTRTISSATANKVISTTDNAKNINQHVAAIKKLEEARNKLNSTDSKYQETIDKLNAKIVEHRNKINEAKGVTDKFNNGNNNLINTLNKVQNAMGLAFGLSAIKGYVNQLISIRGEFEWQQRSLQVLLQNKDEANELWNKTVALAVKSPFKTKDLVTYTKQLAAYRVEADKLYETNRMLADVSSGLGVDMNRLILAYGQVKAANYLRGTELRQFSEAGVNMLGELAQYFTELEGRAVSVGDVFERVSKRMVSFADVDQIFKRITSEGGAFYMMQEKQSETLKGMRMNLRDSIDLMINDIGKMNDDTLKQAVSIVKNLVDNWRALKPVIDMAGMSLFAFFGVKALTKILHVSKAILTLWKTNPFVLIAGAVATLAMFLWRSAEAANALTAAMNEVDKDITSSLEESIDLYKSLTKTMNDATASNKEQAEAASKLKAKFDEILPQQYLELEYIKEIGNNYKDAEEAMFSYYNAKAVEQKKDRINQMYSGEIEGTDVPELIYAIKDITNRLYKHDTISFDDKTRLMAGYSRIINSLVDDLKNGKIGATIDEFNEEFVKRMTDYTGLDEALVKRFIIPPTVAHQVKDLLKTVEKYRVAIDGIAGLPQRTYDEEIAANIKLAEKENLEEAYKTFKNVVDLYKTYANAVESEGKTIAKKRADIQQDVEKILSELPKSLTPYADVLSDAFDKLKQAADKGGFEFAAAAQQIESQIYSVQNNKGETGGFAGIAFSQMVNKENANKAAKEMAQNVQEALNKEASRMKLNDFQDAVIEGARVIAERFGVNLDVFKKFVPQYGESLSVIRQEVEAEIENFESLIEGWNMSISQGATPLSPDILSLSKEEVQNMKDALPALKAFFALLGGILKGKKGKKDSLIEEQLKIIDQMNKKYKELNKTLTKTEALQGAFDAYKDAFATAYGRQDVKQMTAEEFAQKVLNFPNEDDIVKFLDNLKKKAKDKEEQIKVELRRGEYVMDMNVRAKVKSDKELIDEIEKMFSGYELSLELKEMNITPDLAKQLFKIDSLSLKELRNKMSSMKSMFDGTDMEDKYKKYLKKVDEMEEKAQLERLKKYTKYLIQAQGERVKIKMDELRQIAEIEKENTYTDSQKETIKRKLRNETQEALDKQLWEDFKSSEMYTQMFADLEYLGTASIKKLKFSLESLKEALSDLPASDLKEIMQQISKLEELEIERNPFTAMRDSMKEVKKLRAEGRTEQYLQEELTAAQARIDSSQEEADAINIVLNARREGLSLESQSAEWQEKYRYLILSSNEVLQDRLNYLDSAIEKDKNIATQAGIDAKAYVNAKKAAEGLTDNITKWGGAIKDVLGGVDSILDAFGVAEDDTTRLWVNNAMQIADMIVQVVILTASLYAMGVAANSALGVIGWIAIALQAVAMIFAGIFQAGDKKKERQIQRELELVSDLEQAYKRLERSIDNAYSINTLEQSGANAKRNIESQISSYYRMIEAEEAKKKIDRDRIKEWEQTIDDLKMELDDLNNEMVSTATAGIMDSVLSSSQAFTDAWLEAFNETGDGLSGLEENFKSSMMEMVKQQAAMLISQVYVDRWKKQLEQYINPDDLELSTDEARRWVDAVSSSLPQLNQALENYFTAMQQAGVDLSGETSGGLSGLQRGIQGVTEETAQIIEAYLNSIRFFVADSNMQLKTIASAFSGNDDNVNPMVSQLRIIAQQTTAINSLLEGVTKGGHSEGGRGIKVFIS